MRDCSVQLTNKPGDIARVAEALAKRGVNIKAIAAMSMNGMALTRILPDDIVVALSTDGFAECKRELTTSRRGSRPGGGVWQGINTQTGVVASAVWVHRQRGPQAVVFITVEGEALKGHVSRREADSHHEDGGEG